MRRLLQFCASFAGIFILLCVSCLAVEVYIDGEKVPYSDDTGYPFFENGSVLVPLYPTFDAFGNDGIYQDNPNGTVVIKKGSINVSCNTAENSFCRNGTYIASEYGLVWRGGPLYVSTDIFAAFDAEVSVGGSGVIINRSSIDDESLGVYAASFDEAYRAGKYFGAKYEPKNGLYLGCISKNGFSETEDFYEIFGKNAAAFTVYADLYDPYESYGEALEYAVQNGKLVRFVLDGMDLDIPDEDALAKLAAELEASGARVLLSPFGRCNCKHGGTEYDGETAAQAFRRVSEIFRSDAPSVAVVWQMCSCDDSELAAYYPGDVYTDYVEIAVCRADIDDLYGLSGVIARYGYKKPITVFADITENDPDLENSYLEFFTYLPIMYPQVKAMFFSVPDNADILTTGYINNLHSGVADAAYLENSNSSPEGIAYRFSLASDVTVPPSKIKLCCGYDGDYGNISRVVYKLAGKEIAVSEKMPYEAEADFSSLAGKSVVLQVVAYNRDNTSFAQKDYTLFVSTSLSADNTAYDDTAGKVYPAVYVVIAFISVLGIAVVLKKIRDIFC